MIFLAIIVIHSVHVNALTTCLFVKGILDVQITSVEGKHDSCYDSTEQTDAANIAKEISVHSKLAQELLTSQRPSALWEVALGK